jgi:hypothetical protein
MNCDHPGCGCAESTIERDGGRYCSEECAAQGRDGGDCECGHPDCS